MVFRIMMKDPDGVSESIREAAEESVGAMPGILNEQEREDIVEGRLDMLFKYVARWLEYGEYLTVEVDTDAGTIVVVPR